MPRYFDDFPIGTTFELGTKAVTEDAIVAFGREYDNQIFHTDPVAARDSPFGGLVASGLHTFGIFSRLFTDAVMGQTAAIGGAGANRMRWFVPVRPGDVLGARAVEIGLAWEAVPPEDLDRRALELAERAATDPALARLATRSLRTEATAHLPLRVALEYERASQLWSLRRRRERSPD